MSKATKKQLSEGHGTFCWTEIATTDLQATKTFFTKLFGWKINESQNDTIDMEYLEFDTGLGFPSGGMYEMKPEMFGEEVPPSHFMNYITVEDIDAAVKQVIKLGGSTVGEPHEIPETGRMCVVQDPSGATIALITLKTIENEQNLRGQICWFELATPDLAQATKFYSKLFNWKLAQSKNTEMNYLEINTNNESVGGMLQMNDDWKLPETGEMMPAHWMTYIAVENVDLTAKNAKELGGNICIEPVDIPNIGRFSIINDPTGATFTIIKMENS